MTTQPEVSVIIPTFNQAALLPRAINSVFFQTTQDFEIIIVDDGSFDSTDQVVSQINDRRIRYYRHEKNIGAAAARNTAMRLSSGKYIAWLDADDEWLPAKLDRQLYVVKNAKSGLQAICTGYNLFKEGKTRKFIPTCSETWHKTLLLRCDLGTGTTVLFPRGILDDVGLLDESLACYEDWDWIIRVAKKHDLFMIPEPLANIYASAGPPAHVVEQSANIFVSKHEEDFASFGRIFNRRALAKHWFYIATRYYFGTRNIPKERKYLLRSMFAFPFSPLAAYLGLIDTFLGTEFRKWSSNVKQSLIRQLYYQKSQ